MPVGDVKFSLLPAAATLTGAEIVPVVQAGNGVRTTVSLIQNNALGIYTAPGIGAVAQTVSAKLGDVVSVTDFGADPTGVADSTAAIQAALNSGAKAVYVPAFNYRCAGGITIPAGVSVYAFGFQPANPPTGAAFTFDLAVATCVTLGGASANNGSCSIKGISILRAAGAPPAGSIGLLVQNTYASIVEDVASMGHQICFMTTGDKHNVGVCTMVNRLYTGAAYDAHVVIDTTPEIRFNQCRFGMNGGTPRVDQNCNTYVRVTGGSPFNAANGPGTVVFTGCQFNQGANSVSYAWTFVNQTIGTISDIELFQIDNCYFETMLAGFFSDATWPNLARLLVSNTDFNFANITYNLTALNAATQINNCAFSNCYITGQISYTPTNQVNFLTFNGCQVQGTVGLNLPLNSVVLMTDMIFQSSLSLAGAQRACVYMGVIVGALLRGSITSGAPIISLTPHNTLGTWTPVISFGGAAVGQSYSVQQGAYQINGDYCYCTAVVTFTAKGTSVGGASINNLPVPPNGSLMLSSGGGQVTVAIGGTMAGLTGAITLEVSSAVANIYMWGPATGQAALTDANFTNTTAMRLSFSYLRA